MPDLRIPVGRYARRIFWTVIGAGIALIILTRFLLIPQIAGTTTPSVSSVLDESLGNIFATVVSATLLGGIVLWLIAPSKKRADLDIVHPKDVSPELSRALANTRSWHYDGSTARWNRAVALPQLADQARLTGSSRTCRLLIIDPDNQRICKAYMEYRKGVRSGSVGNWDLKTVRSDLCATILLACIYDATESLLDIQLFVKSSSPVYRIDASDGSLILTREDPAEPALACSADTHFYAAFMESINFDARQSRRVTLWNDAPSISELDHQAARRILEVAGIALPEVADDAFVDSILQKVTEPKDPYGSRR
jgi:hypothetical protein